MDLLLDLVLSRLFRVLSTEEDGPATGAVADGGASAIAGVAVDDDTLDAWEIPFDWSTDGAAKLELDDLPTVAISVGPHDWIFFCFARSTPFLTGMTGAGAAAGADAGGSGLADDGLGNV